MNTFSISTAIDYPSGRFHLGHAYEKICTDVIARWKRMKGLKVHFSTGTDCHGQKMQRAAEKAGKAPENFAEEMSEGFKNLCEILNISYNDFIKTTEKRHKKVVINILKQLKENGDIYKGTYKGPYCVDCETFYTEKDLVDGKCPVHKTPVEQLEEESYFFKLSKYQDKLKNIIKDNPDLIYPKKKRNEILNRLSEPLKDLSISRSQVEWGIPLPFDDDMTIFVWVDALINYLSTLGYPGKKFRKFWPTMHVIGSDILWHHTLLWYSLLLSIRVELPRVVVHGFINLKGEKLSKAKGVSVDPVELSNKYGADALRYYLIRNVPFGSDGNFSEEGLVTRLNDELADNYGNLFMRVTKFIKKNFGKVPGPNEMKKEDKKIQTVEQNVLNNYKKAMENLDLNKALHECVKLSSKLNNYFQKQKPWKLIKNDKERTKTVLYVSVNILRTLTQLLWPFIPETSEKALKLLNVEKKKWHDIQDYIIRKGHEVKTGILFEKREKPEVKGKGKEEKKKTKKPEIKAAEIKEVKEHPNADKLYVLKVDLGGEERQLVAGLKEYYDKEELEGKRIIVLTNLEEVELRGKKSEGMLLACKDATLIEPEEDLDNGDVLLKGEGVISIGDFEDVERKVKGETVVINGKQLEAHPEREIEGEMEIE